MTSDEPFLIVEDDDVEIVELSENDDYLIVEDPVTNNPDDWCVLFTKGEYKDMVIKFADVGMNTKTGDLAFNYSVYSSGEGGEKEVDELDFTNYLTSALMQIMTDNHKQGKQRYVDLDTKEEIDY
jgi:hypothetical protein